MMIVQETADSMEDYKSVGADVLLLGGSKSPLFSRHPSMRSKASCKASGERRWMGSTT